jgi:hypothetical protein
MYRRGLLLADNGLAEQLILTVHREGAPMTNVPAAQYLALSTEGQEHLVDCKNGSRLSDQIAAPGKTENI